MTGTPQKMLLVPGTRLGSYQILAPLGAGGMGEVYRARDTRLDRDVALKLLPEYFALDPDRLMRFEREAKTLASLNHPHIAQLYGVEESAGVRALVMELVEGEDLAQRITRGAVPVDEALSIAKQIAEALEAAHEAGIVHRDLKPANIKVRSDGTVKVLDFGLAKGSAAAAPGSAPDAAFSPTFTSPALTQLGVILGTAAYMAPEQAKGQPVDKRADIWAFGLVLYEMLTGMRPFTGEDASEVLAAILRQPVDWTPLPAGTPPALRQLLRRCLQRKPKDRLHDIADARIAIDDLLANVDEPISRSLATRSRGYTLAALVGALALAAGIAAARFIPLLRGTTSSGVTFERLTFRPGHFTNARFAPDGQTMFLAATWDRYDGSLFQIRPKAGELGLGIPGADLLSVSAAGELAVLLPKVQTGNAYMLAGTLGVVSASGGTPRELVDNVLGADWAPDGKSLAVLRFSEGKWRIEYPIGTQIYESLSRLAWIRVSPRDAGVAFFRDDGDGWSVVVAQRSGAVQVLSSGWSDWWNLAWSREGEEIWFGASREGGGASLYAVNRAAHVRPLLSGPGTLEVHDIAPDGAVAMALVQSRQFVVGSDTAGRARDVSWLEASIADDLSKDGTQLLMEGISEREQGGSGVYLRAMDGAPPIRLGSGTPQELSRDGRRALVIRDRSVISLPTGAGAEQVRKTEFVRVIGARWMPNGTDVLIEGQQADGRSVLVVGGFDERPLRSIGRPFVARLYERRNQLLSPLSPDGRYVAIAVDPGKILVVPLDGTEGKTLPGDSPNLLPVQWTADGRGLLVYDPGQLPAKIIEVNLTTGTRVLVCELSPPIATGTRGLSRLVMTPDGKAFAATWSQQDSSLYLVRGLK
jgi:hypothetical protein